MSFMVCEVKDCPGYGTPHPPLPPDCGYATNAAAVKR